MRESEREKEKERERGKIEKGKKTEMEEGVIVAMEPNKSLHKTDLYSSFITFV